MSAGGRGTKLDDELEWAEFTAQSSEAGALEAEVADARAVAVRAQGDLDLQARRCAASLVKSGERHVVPIFVIGPQHCLVLVGVCVRQLCEFQDKQIRSVPIFELYHCSLLP